MIAKVEYEGVYEVLQPIEELQPGQVTRESQLPEHTQHEKEGNIRLIGFVRRDR